MTAVALACSVVAPPPVSAAPTIAQLVGQKLVVAMSGTTPGADLLGRIARGEVGGVILFGANIATASSLRSLTDRLASAAAEGGQPPLLIATDQEGGSVRRIPWAAPARSAAEMGAVDDPAEVSSQGKAAGWVMRCAGINADLAPVADLPNATSSFMYQQRRTWSFDAAVTADLSTAFAAGLEAAGSVPAMKHFPGIGLATSNTDTSVVTISASRSALAPGLRPYRQAIADGIPLIMLSNATYPAYDGSNAAGWSRAVSVGLLRDTLGFTGVSITDSLSGTAAARGVSASSLAIKAAQAGTDMLLVTGSEASTKATYARLMRAAENGVIPLQTLRTSYSRIVALKSKLRGAVADATRPGVRTTTSRLYSPSTLGSTTVPVKTSWSASDACGISRYSLRRRMDGGAWTAQRFGSATATSVRQSLPLASRATYAIRAVDGAGNASRWSYGPTFEPVVRQSSSSYVTFSGEWSTVAGAEYSGGSTRYASAGGASASYTFTGTSIGWVAAAGPTRGSAQVYVDGTYERTVSLYSTTTGLRRIVYVRNWRRQGSHTITVVVVGTPGHARVDVDAFVRLYQP